MPEKEEATDKGETGKPEDNPPKDIDGRKSWPKAARRRKPEVKNDEVRGQKTNEGEKKGGRGKESLVGKRQSGARKKGVLFWLKGAKKKKAHKKADKG